MKKITVSFIVIGIILIIIGAYQNFKYEKVKGTPITVTATVSKISEKADMIPPYEKLYNVYGDYVYKGKKHRHTIIETTATPPELGTVLKDVNVTPVKNDPFAEGGVLGAAGIIFIAIASIYSFFIKKDNA